MCYLRQSILDLMMMMMGSMQGCYKISLDCLLMLLKLYQRLWEWHWISTRAMHPSFHLCYICYYGFFMFCSYSYPFYQQLIVLRSPLVISYFFHVIFVMSTVVIVNL